MALTASDYQGMILIEVGAGLDGENPGKKQILDQLTPAIEAIWGMWATKGLVNPMLQFLYTKRQALDFCEGQVRHLIDVSAAGVSHNYTSKLQSLETLRKNVTTEIDRWETMLAASRPCATAPMITKAPVGPDYPGQVDPNDRAFRGDAIRRQPRIWPWVGNY